MGNFNEIQKGKPHLDSNYWQELNKNDKEETELDIVNMNCQTIFNSDKLKNNIKSNPSIFEK